MWRLAVQGAQIARSKSICKLISRPLSYVWVPTTARGAGGDGGGGGRHSSNTAWGAREGLRGTFHDRSTESWPICNQTIGGYGAHAAARCHFELPVGCMCTVKCNESEVK